MSDSELQARGASNKEMAETASIRCTMTLCEENKGADNSSRGYFKHPFDFQTKSPSCGRCDSHARQRGGGAARNYSGSVRRPPLHFNLTNSWNSSPTLSFVFKGVKQLRYFNLVGQEVDLRGRNYQEISPLWAFSQNPSLKLGGQRCVGGKPAAE